MLKSALKFINIILSSPVELTMFQKVIIAWLLKKPLLFLCGSFYDVGYNPVYLISFNVSDFSGDILSFIPFLIYQSFLATTLRSRTFSFIPMAQSGIRVRSESFLNKISYLQVTVTRK